MSHEDLRSLLTELADDVNHSPQREFSGQALAQAHRIRRRRVVLGVAAAVVLVGVPVALLVPRADIPVQPGDPVYSDTPLRGRAAHTATLLGDGRVLIVGGCATDGCTTAEGAPSSEYYLPGQGFTAGPELGQPRQGHAAVALTDGRVLIVGGWAREGAPPLDSAEVFQPRTGRFEPSGSMTQPRGGATATVLADGRVLLAGGYAGPRQITETAEIFDPVANRFVAVAPMPQARHAAAAITLTDGRVLVVGGEDASGALTSALLYDPDTDTWQATGSLGTPRSKLAVAPLPDGRVLVLGGTPDDQELLGTTEIYDPGTGRFEPGPRMDIGRYKFSVAVDADGRVIAAGGTQVAAYDPATGNGQFHPIAGPAGPSRLTATVTGLPSGDVLIVGGYTGSIRLLDDALLITASQVAAAAPAG